MGLHNTAHYLKSKGRGNDTMLVHMTPGEVKGLQAIALRHGGSLTINPDTGLPEAGFLENILPVVAAAGLTYLTAGAAAPALAGALGTAGMGAAAATTAGGILAGAGAGALISGGTAALQGKDVGQAALMGGLGGGIAGGMGAYTPTELAPAALTGATGTASSAGTAALDPSLASYGQTAMTPQQISQGVSQGTITPQAANQYGQAFTESFAANPTVQAPPTTMYSGFGDMTKMGVQALPALGLLEDKPTAMPGQEQYDENSPYRMRLSKNFRGSEPVRPNPYYRAQYAAGGITGASYPQSGIDSTQYAVPSQMPTSAEVVASDYDTRVNPYTGMNAGGSVPKPLPRGDAGIYSDTDPATRNLGALAAAQHRLKGLGKRTNVQMAKGVTSGIKDLGGNFSDMAAKGGVADLGGYSDGGRLLRGPGDGMSDNIPATIGRKQPARLADGEFVVPADVVSHLGNGSTDAGAKKLYAMMDKIRKARTGKKKQAPQVKADKYMPA
jgi:hypothetical protein